MHVCRTVTASLQHVQQLKGLRVQREIVVQVERPSRRRSRKLLDSKHTATRNRRHGEYRFKGCEEGAVRWGVGHTQRGARRQTNSTHKTTRQHACTPTTPSPAASSACPPLMLPLCLHGSSTLLSARLYLMSFVVFFLVPVTFSVLLMHVKNTDYGGPPTKTKLQSVKQMKSLSRLRTCVLFCCSHILQLVRLRQCPDDDVEAVRVRPHTEVDHAGQQVSCLFRGGGGFRARGASSKRARTP